MIYTDLTKKAMVMAYQAHDGQCDKSGIPYIFHPIHLAEQMEDENTTIVALLHDVIEDTDITLEQIASNGFSDEILTALEFMTRDDKVQYMDYIEKIKTNKIATIVKLADLKHNSDATRLSAMDAKARKRLEKYKQAIDLLQSKA